MALAPRLDLRLGQNLVLTPQLQQAIKLLQMANLELQGYVAGEIERNPLLESEDGGEDVPERESVELSGFEREDGVYAADAGLAGEGMVAERDAPLDADFERDVFDDAPVDVAVPGDQALGLGNISGGSGSFEGGDTNFESRLADQGDLRSHVTSQLAALALDPADWMIAANLVDCLEDSGRLSPAARELPERLGCSDADLEAVLVRLQTLEPTGIFARDLAECLALQLRELDRLDPAMATLLEHLDLLGRQDLAALRRLCGVDAEDLVDMIREIRALDPLPGRAFGGIEPQTLIPDVFVRRLPNGAWGVELNSDTLPKVLVNRQYYSELNARAGSRDDRHYLSECLSNANWLVRALDQRARTVLKVATEIVRQQEGFFSHGVRHLRPLILRDIAEVISMHESTVSRVTSSKYMATNRGIFEFKYFFTSAIQSAGGGDAHSSESVRDRIRTLIDAESPKRILSDDALVDMLKAEGIDIARRTVAKYREAMRIGSSVERRRAKRMAG